MSLYVYELLDSCMALTTSNEGGEVENPRERVPRAMTWSYGVGWLFLVTFMFTFNFHIGDPEVIGTAPPGWV